MSPRPGSAGEVFHAFLGLGLTSFGGPVAHLGYFREAFVVRRRWLDEQAYADLVALCQLLPGPASSQVGMAIGLRRAGRTGMLAAWLAFTAPSAVLLVAFAYGADALETPAGAGWIRGLEAAAAAVVAWALIGMARSLTPDLPRLGVALAALAVVLAVQGTAGQVTAIAAGAALGLLLLRAPPLRPSPPLRPASPDAAGPAVPRTALAALGAFVVLLAGLPALAAATSSGVVTLADAFYRAGALVFGGGHVVLPLLEAEVVAPGWVDRDAFVAGYGAAQAVPGPLFTFAAYLGAIASVPPGGVAGALVALAAIFLPSALLIAGTLPFHERLRDSERARRALAGTGAAVVGLLAAAFYDPVLTQGVDSPAALAVAAAAFAALAGGRLPVWAVVVGASLAGAVVI